jgi:hypothetical protein
MQTSTFTTRKENLEYCLITRKREIQLYSTFYPGSRTYVELTEYSN